MENLFLIILQCLASTITAALATLVLNQLALIPWRRATALHWTERARILTPIRLAARQNLWTIPLNLTLAQEVFWPGRVPWGISAACAWLGSFLALYPFDRLLFPEFKFRDWLHHALATWVIYLAYWGTIIASILLMPKDFGWLTWATFGGVLFVIVAFNWGAGIWLCRKLNVLKPADERLLRLVSKASEKLGVPVRHTWILAGPVSYAAAIPTTKDLIFSEKVIQLHAEEELAAVCHHEMGHLSEPKAVLAGRLAGVFFLLPVTLIKPVTHHFSLLGSGAILVSSVLLLKFAQRLARRMEVRADSVASQNQTESGTYARALERLYQTNQVPAVMRNNNGAHPHLYDRLLAAGVIPDYPRPKAPKGTAWPAFIMWCLAAILAMTLAAIRG